MEKRAPGRWRAALLVGTVVALVTGVIGLSGNAFAATLFSDDFADGDASGWTTSGGSWSVVTDGSSAYQQSSTSSDARARAGTSTWTDYTVTARVKPTAVNGSNRFVAVLARAQSATSYYYLALRTNNTVELKKLVGGSSTTLATASATVSTGTWYTLSLQVAGSTLTGSVNGASTVTASDTAFSAGQIGVATYYASAVFDDVLVDGVTTTPTTPTTAATSPTVAPTTPTTTPATTATPTSVPTTPTSVPPVPTDGPIGFASMNALGVNGTTGGVGGSTVVVDTTDELLTAIDTVGPLIIQVQGTINITSKQGVRPNKTIIGLGTTATINGGGFDFYKSYNVIVRNLTFTNADDDSINIGQNSHHIWIDHNDFYSAADGSVDIVRGSDYVTVSWNHFRGTDKSMLIGHSDSNTSEDTGHLTVTIHHNWFDGSHQRHPRVRFSQLVHVYNNYYQNVDVYAVASTMDGAVLVEGCYFSNVPYPFYAKSGYADSGPGRLVQRGNVFVGSGDSTSEPTGTVPEASGYYSYTLDSAASVPSTVPAGAGVGKLGL